MGGHREAEVGGQPLGDGSPGRTVVVAAVHAEVVLQEESLGHERIACDLVHALTELGERIGHEPSTHSGVRRRPRRAGVFGAVDPARRHSDEHLLRVGGVRKQRMDGLPAETGSPLWTVRVIP